MPSQQQRSSLQFLAQFEFVSSYRLWTKTKGPTTMLGTLPAIWVLSDTIESHELDSNKGTRIFLHTGDRFPQLPLLTVAIWSSAEKQF